MLGKLRTTMMSSTLAAKGGDIIVLTSPDGGVTLTLTSG